VSIVLNLVFIIIAIQMVRGGRGQQMPEAPNDQQFLRNFYEELTLSNFNSKITSEEDAIRYCQLSGLLPSRNSPAPNCPTHTNTVCNISTDRTRKLGFSYVCSLQDCRKKISPTVNTCFHNSKLTFKQGLHIILCYTVGLKHKQAVREAKLDKNTITEWFGFLREVQMIVVSQPRKIGGVYLDENGEIQCDFVEVDESQICNRKYSRGRLYNTESQRLWVVGGVCRRTRQAFMVRVPNRKINVIDYLLKKWIEVGSILVTDSARVYENIPARLNMDHYKVNHSLNFVHPNNRDINTNMIESRWAAVKNKVKSYKNTNYIESCIAQHLYEFEYLYPLKEKFSYGKVFEKLVSDITRVYTGPNPQNPPLELVEDDWDNV
jgi:hypothetical protein